MSRLSSPTRRELVSGLASLWAVGCGSPTPSSSLAPSDRSATDFSFDGARPDLDQGQKAPPLPPDLEVWAWDAGGFVGDAVWYGEHDWDGVRMRLMGHLAWLGRDRARLAAASGDLPGARAALVATSRDLSKASPKRRGGVAMGLHNALTRAIQRDTALFDALQGTPIQAGADAVGVVAALLQGQDPTPVLSRLEAPPEALDIDQFRNFDERHALRVDQWAAWGTIADPLGLTPSWGYFDQAAWKRHHAALTERVAAARSAGTPKGMLLALATTRAATPVPIRVDDLVALPTGDSFIDTAASPGPRAIGVLWMMGADDRAFVDWAGQLADQLSRLADTDPDGALRAIRAAVSAVNQHAHGSRFYNVKQLRNAGVRILASRGHGRQAAQLLADQRPLHNQDWACPNRAGILRGLEGRLALASGDTTTARAALDEATDLSRAFLADVSKAERDPSHGLRPPGFGPPPGQKPKGQQGPPPKRR
mgnify:FL=1